MLYLVRDPRGVISSRGSIHANLRNQSSRDFEKEVKAVCDAYSQNVAFIRNFTSNKSVAGAFKERVAVLRYEDFAYDPKGMATRMYAHLGQALPARVEQYIARATRGGPKRVSPYSVRRNSKATARAFTSRSKRYWMLGSAKGIIRSAILKSPTQRKLPNG